MVLCDTDLDVSGITQKWHKLRRRCASFKAITGSGPTSLDSDASYVLTEPSTNYSVVARQQRASSVVSSGTEHHKQRHHYTWRKSHSAEKYDYRDVNLNSSVPEKINKRIPLPEDYWKVHEQDVKTWKIGTCSPPQRPPREKEKDNSDWEHNVKKYENMGEEQRQSRIQYFTGSDEKGNRKNSLEGDRKELKIPGLKAFKSASMRLPGQRSSIHEVHQMLRNKLKNINVGLRKKRTMSVQEVFQTPSSQQQQQQQQQQDTPSQFYVPSPAALNKFQDDNDGNGPSSLPYTINGTHKPTIDNSYNNSSNSSGKKKMTATSSLSSASLKTISHQSENEHKKSVQRSQSYRSRHHKNNDLKGEHSVETASSSSPNKQGKTTISSPDFHVGGRVSLRERNDTRTPSMAAKMTNVVKNKIRMRPRSHSPLKSTKGEQKLKKNRESFGLFDKINRMMHPHHLPPPHNNNNSHTNNKNHSNNKPNNNSPAKSSTSIVNTVKLSNSDELAANRKESSASDAAKENLTTTTNSKCDFNQARKPSSQLPETISVRDRKITKQTFLV